jgi:hypothetical protein
MARVDEIAQANNEFSRALLRASLRRFASLGSGRRRDLVSLEEARRLLSTTGEHYVGTRSIPVARIVGSEGRYRDFDRQFLPRSKHLRARWVRISLAHLGNINLPAVKVYELGGVYFIRDGNHRVSVARDRRIEFIDAEVTALSTDIALPADLTEESLRSAVVRHERRLFFEALTGLTKQPGPPLELTAVGSYEEIAVHIMAHRRLLEQATGGGVTREQATLSWHAAVYLPIARLIEDSGAMEHLPGRTVADLYLWLVRNWTPFLRALSRAGSRDLARSLRSFKRHFGGGSTQRHR